MRIYMYCVDFFVSRSGPLLPGWFVDGLNARATNHPHLVCRREACGLAESGLMLLIYIYMYYIYLYISTYPASECSDEFIG